MKTPPLSAHRLGSETAVELIGGADKYVAVCRGCYFKQSKKDSTSTMPSVVVTSESVSAPMAPATSTSTPSPVNGNTTSATPEGTMAHTTPMKVTLAFAPDSPQRVTGQPKAAALSLSPIDLNA